MFLGHFAVGCAAKRVAPGTSLGTLFAAAQALDLLWPNLLLLGLERVRIDPGNTAMTPLDFEAYPYTHSLVGAMAWAVAAGLLYFAIRRYRTGAIVIAACVVSHWFLDLLVHRPDLPVIPGSPLRVGLGLWNAPAVTWILELGSFAAGAWIYLRATRPRDRIGSWGFFTLAAALVAIYFANALGPPPPNAQAIAWAGQAQWLLVAWAWWADRHRSPHEAHQPAK